MCETNALIWILDSYMLIHRQLSIAVSVVASSSIDSSVESSHHTHKFVVPHTDDVCLMFDKNSISRIPKVPCTLHSAQVQQWKKRFIALYFSCFRFLKWLENVFSKSLCVSDDLFIIYLLLSFCFYLKWKKIVQNWVVFSFNSPDLFSRMTDTD